MHAADIWKAECLPGTTPLFYAGGETRGGYSGLGVWLLLTNLNLLSAGRFVLTKQLMSPYMFGDMN